MAAMEVAAMVDVAVENKILVSRGGVACKLLGEISILSPLLQASHRASQQP